MNNIERHKAICEELHALYEKKNHDYGDSFSKTYKELGIVSAVTQIMHKHNRLVTLAVGADQKIGDESIRDTLIDLANYAIMTVLELETEPKAQHRDKFLKYRGHEIALSKDGAGVFKLESGVCVICDICCHRDRDEDAYPCKMCWHGDGNKEHFVLDEDVVEVSK